MLNIAVSFIVVIVIHFVCIGHGQSLSTTVNLSSAINTFEVVSATTFSTMTTRSISRQSTTQSTTMTGSVLTSMNNKPTPSSPMSSQPQSASTLESVSYSTISVLENTPSITFSIEKNQSSFSIKTPVDSVFISSTFEIFSTKTLTSSPSYQSNTSFHHVTVYTSTSKWSNKTLQNISRTFPSFHSQSKIRASFSSSANKNSSVTARDVHSSLPTNLWSSNTPIVTSASSFPLLTATFSSMTPSFEFYKSGLSTITTTMSSFETSVSHSSSLIRAISSTLSVSQSSSRRLTTRSLMFFSDLTSLSIAFTRPEQSEESASRTKSSKTSNATKLRMLSPSINIKKWVMNNSNVMDIKISFIEFNGILVVSQKSSSKRLYPNLNDLADLIEKILEKALRKIIGYIYSKILSITAVDDRAKFKCTFKLYITEPSSETARTLEEAIKKYNKTNGFGQFLLHSLETSFSSDKSATEEKLHLWAIITIAALGVLCILAIVAFSCTVRKLKRLRKRSNSLPSSSSNQKYTDFFPPVFGSNGEPQNEPLKLGRVLSTESNKLLKLSDTVDTDSDKSEKSLFADDRVKTDLHIDDQEKCNSNHSTLQVQGSSAEEEETKFSTFSRKR